MFVQFLAELGSVSKRVSKRVYVNREWFLCVYCGGSPFCNVGLMVCVGGVFLFNVDMETLFFFWEIFFIRVWYRAATGIVYGVGFEDLSRMLPFRVKKKKNYFLSNIVNRAVL